jgi:hypothetical protein
MFEPGVAQKGEAVMPRRETRKAGILGDLEHLSATMEANKEQLPLLEPFRLKLGDIVTRSLDVSKQQAAFTASKQEASKQLRQLLTQGLRVADVIRTVVRDHYGPQEEKIAEFGVQPFRGRKVKTPTETPPTPTTPPAPAGSA